MKRFAYYFGIYVCGAMVIMNSVMVYLSIGISPLGWLGTVFFAAFSGWWGWQLYRFAKEFRHLKS